MSVFVLDTVKEGDCMMVAAALTVAGYGKIGDPPNPGETIAIFPDTKMIRAHVKGAEILDDEGKPRKIVQLNTDRLLALLFDSVKEDAIEQIIGEEGEGILVMDNGTNKMGIGLGLAKKIADGKCPPEIMVRLLNPDVIALLVGSILSAKGLI